MRQTPRHFPLSPSRLSCAQALNTVRGDAVTRTCGMVLGLGVLFGVMALGLVAPPTAHAETPAPLRIVAAERVWGDIARQLGGEAVVVDSIMSAPDLDPHLFEPTPATARAVAGAAFVIANGGGYDGWMDRLAQAGRSHTADTYLRVSDIIHWQDGENDHFWCDPAVVRRVTATLAADLDHATSDPAARARIRTQAEALDTAIAAVQARVTRMRQHFAGARVAATEPLLDRLLSALGLIICHDAFQRAVMNDVEPGPADVAAFESDLRNGTLRVLIYNSQTVTPASTRLLSLAREAGVPCIAVPETLPTDLHWQGWMDALLDRLEQGLSSTAPAAGMRDGRAPA